GPGDQMGRAGEHGHVHAELGDELLSGDLADAADLIKLGDLVGERGDHQVDPAAQLLDLGGELVDAFQHQLADLGAHGAAGHLANTLGSRWPAIIAWSICRPQTPNTSETVADSLIWAS